MASSVYLLLPCQEEQNVAGVLVDMDLHHTFQGSIQVISLGFFGIHQGNIMGSSRDAEYFAIEEIGGEFFGLQSGGGNNQCKIVPFLHNPFQYSEKNISVDAPLMGLV